MHCTADCRTAFLLFTDSDRYYSVRLSTMHKDHFTSCCHGHNKCGVLVLSHIHSGVKSLTQHSLIKDQYGFTHKHEHTSSFSLYNFFFHYVYVIYMYILLIKTITKFSNVIGSQQPDLSINWTVTHVMLVTGEYAPFCARCCGALC